MKKLSQVLICLGFCCAVLGIVFSVLLMFTPLQLVFFKSFLTDALEKNGYEVRWERVKEGKLTFFEPSKQENSKILYLREYGKQLIVFIEESRSMDGSTGIITISGTQTVLSWPNLSELARLFPPEDMQKVGDRLGRVREQAVVYGGVIGAILFGLGIGLDHLSSLKKRRVRKTVRKKVPRVAAPNPVVRVQALPVVPVVIQRPRQEGIDQDWASLFERVRYAIDHVQKEVQESLEGEFVNLSAEKNPGRRIKKARHLLLKIQKIREVVFQEPVEVSEGIHAPADRQPPLPPPSLEQVLKTLLPIDEYVPSHLNPEIVQKVILAFLRPGHSVSFVEARYTSVEELLEYLREVPRDETKEILKWLRGIGVLMERRPHRKAGRTFVSLRIHGKDMDSPGREIIQTIARATYEKARMGLS